MLRDSNGAGTIAFNAERDDEFRDGLGSHCYMALKLPDNQGSVVVAYQHDEMDLASPHRISALKHNLSEGFLARLPGMHWQAALSDAILRSPADSKAVICEGPSYTGKTLTALATLIEMMSSDDQDVSKMPQTIVFPYRLFRAEDYAQGYEWFKGLPIAPNSGDRGWDYAPDRRRLAFTNPLIDTWYEIGRLKGGSKDQWVSPIDFLCDHCEFCEYDSLVQRRVSDAYIFLDNFQNYTIQEAQQLLNTVGYNSKAIILGNLEQISRPQCTRTENGLAYVMDRLVGKPNVDFVRFLVFDRPSGMTSLL